MTMISLRKAQRNEVDALHRIQLTAFRALLDKYQDLDTNPGAEGIERIVERYDQEYTNYYFIQHNDTIIGMIRVCDFGDICHVSPICILPEYQGNGYAQKAMLLAEKQYPNAHKWKLDTIRQEQKLCYLYEKLGYVKTGKQKHVQEGMDLVYYAKII